MARNKKPRKAHRPRPVLVYAHENAINRMQPMTDDQTTDLAIAYRIALDGLLTNPNSQDFYTVKSQLMISRELCQQGFGDFADKIDEALDALDRAERRAVRLGSWALDGTGIQAVRDAVALSEIQFERVAVKHISEALQKVKGQVERMAA